MSRSMLGRSNPWNIKTVHGLFDNRLLTIRPNEGTVWYKQTDIKQPGYEREREGGGKAHARDSNHIIACQRYGQYVYGMRMHT